MYVLTAIQLNAFHFYLTYCNSIKETAILVISFSSQSNIEWFKIQQSFSMLLFSIFFSLWSEFYLYQKKKKKKKN